MTNYLPLEADRLLDLSLLEIATIALPGPAEVLEASLPEPLVDRNFAIRARWTELWSPVIAMQFQECLAKQMLAGVEALRQRIRALAISQKGKNAMEEKLFSLDVAQTALQELAAPSELQRILRAFLCGCCSQSRLYQTPRGVDEYFRGRIATLSCQSPIVISGVLKEWQWSSKFRQAIIKDLKFLGQSNFP